MGLSIGIAGAIVLMVILAVMMAMTGLVSTMFSLGDASTQISEVEKVIYDTQISMDHLSVLIGSSKVNFTLNNIGAEKLWNFDDFNLFIEYDGAISGKKIEELTFNGECQGIAPSSGNWCIQSITGDILDPDILNSGERASIWTQVNENLVTNNGVISVTTDNGVSASVSTTTCGSFCYQIFYEFNSKDQVGGMDWDDMPAALTEFNGNANYRTILDLTEMQQWRFFSRSEDGAGTATCELGVQYSTDNVNWNGLDNGILNSMSTARNSCDLIGYFVTAWSPLNVTAQADVWIRAVGQGGDGSANPDFGTLQVQFRS